MTSPRWISVLFLVAAIYDGILGFIFFFAPFHIFRMFAAEPPTHPAYVQFPALLLLVFAALFYKIASDPSKYREMIAFGCGLKIAFAGLALGYQARGGIPAMWIPLAWADLAFLVLFLSAWRSLAKLETGAPEIPDRSAAAQRMSPERTAPTGAALGGAV